MTGSIELLYRFQGNDSDSKASEKLGCVKATLAMARKRGRLSPELTAEIAEKLGENAVFWMAVAAAEAQVEPARSKLLGLIEMDGKWRARRDSNPRPLPSEGVKSRRTAENAKPTRLDRAGEPPSPLHAGEDPRPLCAVTTGNAQNDALENPSRHVVPFVRCYLTSRYSQAFGLTLTEPLKLCGVDFILNGAG